MVFLVRPPVPPAGVLHETGRAQSGSPFGAEKEGAFASFAMSRGDLFPGDPGGDATRRCRAHALRFGKMAIGNDNKLRKSI
jgi:hypothetical protein